MSPKQLSLVLEMILSAVQSEFNSGETAYDWLKNFHRELIDLLCGFIQDLFPLTYIVYKHTFKVCLAVMAAWIIVNIILTFFDGL